jgi:glutaminase
MDIQALLNEIASLARDAAVSGHVATYIPALGKIDPARFGIAFASVDGGDVVGSGDFDVPFSVQSIAKVFALSLVLENEGESLWQRVGREPSGNPFNSLVQLEYEKGIPRNPFINAGALVVVDRLITRVGDAHRAVRALLRDESGNATIDVDEEVAQSEAEHGHRNAALAHFLASYGNLENPVEHVLAQYIHQSSLAASCADLARAGLFLARHGTRANGASFLSRSEAKRINAILLTCGTYDAAGEFAYRVGLPAKSGVGGGILAILPGRGCICAWGPALDKSGNSAASVHALDLFTTRTGWSIF